MICHCPATKVVLEQFTAEFQGLTRLFDLPPFATSQPDAMTRLLGSPPPHILREGWIQEATPICGEFAYALRMHITSLQPSIVDPSCPLMTRDDAESSDSNDDFSPILFPPDFLLSDSNQPAYLHPAACSYPEPSNSTNDWATYSLQMAQVRLVFWQDCRMEKQSQVHSAWADSQFHCLLP